MPAPFVLITISLNKGMQLLMRFVFISVLLTGIDHPYISYGNSVREFIIHSAAVYILLALRLPFSGEKPEFVLNLKKFLLSSVVPMFIQVNANKSKEDDQQHSLNNGTQCAASGNTLGSSKRASLSTKNLVEARNLRNKQMQTHNTRTRALDARIKQQKAAFTDIAKEIHHGSTQFIFGLAEGIKKAKT